MKRSDAKSFSSAFALAAVIAAGTIFLWFLFVGWISGVAIQLFKGPDPNERLAFSAQGEPIVESISSGGSGTTTYRTIDGQTIDHLEDVELQYGGTWFVPPGMKYSGGTDWAARIYGFPAPGGGPAYWYLVAPGEHPTRAYFVGYDARTKQRIGYLGTAGFRGELPQRDEQFVISPDAIRGWNLTAGLFHTTGEEPDRNYYWKGQPRSVFLNSDGKLLRIDLRHRSIAPVQLEGEIRALSNLYQPVPGEDDASVAQKVRIGVMLDGNIAILDENGEFLRAVPIPAEARNRVLSVFLTTTDETIIVAMSDWNHALNDVYWINPQGQIARHQQVALIGRTLAFDSPFLWLAGISTASPLLCAAEIGFTEPRRQLQIGRYDEYSQSVAASLARYWPALLAVMAISTAVALLAYRRQMRYGGQRALAWFAFVLLLGPAGYISYLVHRRWPARALCGQCRRWTPVDRAECLVCEAEFPLPAPRGIEIFA